MAGSAAYPPMQPVVGEPKKRHGWQPLVIWILVGLLVVGAGLGIGYYFAVRSFGESIGRGFSGLSQMPAAAEASEADQAAHAHQVPDAALTPGVLNSWNMGLSAVGSPVTWVGADASIPDPGDGGYARRVGTYVSVSVGSAHVLTAVNDGACAFGLAVSDPNDPIIAADHLPGTGSFSAQNPSLPCSAASAPSKGWKLITLPPKYGS